MRVPLGVVGIIYEARPNVTVDAAGLCLKSGNAVLLRGSSSAHASATRRSSTCCAAAATAPGCRATASSWCRATTTSRSKHLMRARGLVDVLIPRGGAGLIRSVVEESTVPVIETGVGNCHVYVDADADLDMAIDDHPQRQDPAAQRLQRGRDDARARRRRRRSSCRARWRRCRPAGVTIHGDDAVASAYSDGGRARPPTRTGRRSTSRSTSRSAWSPSLTAAVAHIRRWASGHTEAIVTGRWPASQAFVAGLDSAAVMVNASTRFTDGEQFGFGAEIGISTQKLHARGPMGLAELTTTTWIVTGDGQVRT